MKDGTFYAVQSWMVKDLGLKGLEKEVYAIIYGFTQDGESEYKGGIAYLCDWTLASKRGVIKCLQNLVSNGLLLRSEYKINGINYVNYIAVRPENSKIKSVEVVNRVHLGGEQSAPRVVNRVHLGGEQSSHNNIYNNISDNIYNNISDESCDSEKKTKNKNTKEIDQEAVELANLLEKLHKENCDSTFNARDKKKWALEIEKIHRIDKKDYCDIQKVITWSKKDSFWKSNIISPLKLRKQYDMLKAKMNTTNVNGNALKQKEANWEIDEDIPF